MNTPIEKPNVAIESKQVKLRKIWLHALYGVLFGLTLPLAATMVESRLHFGEVTVKHIWHLQATCAIFWIIDSTPVWMGFIAAIAGFKQDRIDALIKSLQSQIRTKTTELELSQQRMENTMDSMADLMIVLDNQGMIKKLNHSALRVFGYEKSALIGQSAAILLGEEDLDRVMLNNPGDLFDSGFLQNIEGAYPTQYGYSVDLSISMSYIWDEEGNRDGIVCMAQDISERIERENLLEKTKRSFESLFNSAPIPIVIIRNRQIVFHNEEAEKLSRYSSDELLSLTIDQFIYPDDLELVFIDNGKTDENQRPNGMKSFRILTRDNEVRWVDLKSTPFTWDDQLSELAYFIDTTDQRTMEQELRYSEERYRTIFDNSPIALCINQGIDLIFSNPALEKLYGYSKDELSTMDVIYEEDRQKIIDNMVKTISNPEIRYIEDTFRIVNKSGEIRWVESICVIVDWQDKDTTFSFQTDITERKKAEEKIKEQNRKLEAYSRQMTDELEQAKLAQRTLLPLDLPEFPNIKLARKYNPMAQIGGDFYDLFMVDPKHLGIMVGDVTGHGIPAALLSFLFLTTFKNSRLNGTTPDEIMELSNSFLAGKIPEGKYASLFYCMFDLEKNVLSYASAGHPPGLLIRPGVQQTIHLQTLGMVLGMFENPVLPFESKSIKLHPGDKVLIYTDGIFEISNDYNELISEEEWESFLMSQGRLPIEKLLDRVFDFCTVYSGQRGFDDDVTMIGLEVL